MLSNIILTLDYFVLFHARYLSFLLVRKIGRCMLRAAHVIRYVAFISQTRQQIRYYYCHLVYFPFAHCAVDIIVVVVFFFRCLGHFMTISIPKEKPFMLISLGMGNGPDISYTRIQFMCTHYFRCMAIHRLISWTSHGMLNYAYVPW